MNLAGELGFDLTKESILDFLKFREEVNREKAAKAENKVMEALEESDLDKVAGGTLSICTSTYNPGENCYFTDDCNIIWNHYDPMYDVQPDDPVVCKNNTENPHYMQEDGYLPGWEVWDTYCPQKANADKTFPKPDPFDD